MLQRVYHIIVVTVVYCLMAGTAVAQQGIYVPPKGKIYFSGDTATIFSNVINQGKLGVDKKAVVNFKGKTWQNHPDALITDEGNKGEDASGTGGIIRFNGVDSGRQQIDGGYNPVTKSGPAFPNVDIRNGAGVEVINSAAKIRRNLVLTTGLLYLQDNTLAIGDGYPGAIIGYDSIHYIITGGSGLLVRENVTSQNNWVIFPIGSKENAYTPAAIRSNTTRGDDYYARVGDGVKSNLFTGSDLNPESVNKTWEIGKRFHPNQDVTDIVLQHLVADEGALFNANRSHSYISQYSIAGWDTAYPQIYPGPGYLTTQPNQPILNAATNTRTFDGRIGSTSYFTKLTGKGDTVLNRTHVWLNGYRLDYNNVRVYWTTKPEINNRYFVVQRRLSNETDWKNLDTVQTRSVNGYSSIALDYSIIDPNNYSGNSFYRLMLVDYNNVRTYTYEVVVGNKPGGLQLLLWPNPSPRDFYVGINGVASVKYVVVWDILGQLLHRELVNNRTIIPMRLWKPGQYVVGFISDSNQIIETKKLIITGW